MWVPLVPLVMKVVAKEIPRRALLGAGLALPASRSLAQGAVPGKAFSRVLDLPGQGALAGALISVGTPRGKEASGGPVRAAAVW